jgi:hypothetical protein
MADAFDSFIEAIDKLIDARDDQWFEEEHNNYRQSIDIYENRIKPAQEQIKASFELAVEQAVAKILANR